MNIVIDRKHFLDKVDLLKEITKVKSNLPVTRNVLIDLTGGNQGKISATNLDISAVTDLKLSYEGEPVKIMVKGGTLEEVLANLKSQNIDMQYDVNGLNGSNGSNSLTITQDRIEIGLAVGDPDEFPEIDPINEVENINLSAKDILHGISKVFYAISSDETRYVLTGMLMQVRGGKLIMCGTDGFRMSLWKKDLKDEADTPQIVIPARNVKVIKSTIGEHANVGIVITQERVQMMTDSVTIIARTISGAFPDYEAVCAGDWQHIMFVKRVEMLESLNRVSSVRTANDPVSLHRIGDDGLQIDVKSDLGYCREIIDAKYKSSAPLDFAFNGKFLIDALEHLEGEEITIRYQKEYSAIVFEESDYTCVVMPIRDSASPIEEIAKNKSQSAGHKSPGQEDITEKPEIDLSEKALENLKNLCPDEGSSIDSVTISTENQSVTLTKESRKKAEKLLSEKRQYKVKKNNAGEGG